MFAISVIELGRDLAKLGKYLLAEKGTEAFEGRFVGTDSAGFSENPEKVRWTNERVEVICLYHENVKGIKNGAEILAESGSSSPGATSEA